MAKRNRPLGMETPRIRAARGQVVGDSFNGREVRRLMIKA
jgi:hypothetical protein